MNIANLFKKSIEIKSMGGHILLKCPEANFTKSIALPSSLDSQEDLGSFSKKLGLELLKFGEKVSKLKSKSLDQSPEKVAEERRKIIEEMRLNTSEVMPRNRRESVKFLRSKIEAQRKRLETMLDDLKSFKGTKYLKSSQAASIFNISPRTLQRRADKGWILFERLNGPTSDRQYRTADILAKLEEILLESEPT